MLSTGRAIKVCSFSENNRKFQLSITELEQILSNDRIKDREAVVISIAGGFRSGKSFLLNFFLKFLYAKYVHHDLSNDWMGDKDEDLTGFEWRGGCSRVTTGIEIWSEVFLHDFIDGRKVAIILMDTQGTFDNEGTMNDSIVTFTLSTLMSSVQIYNLMNKIGIDNLHHLQLFAEYGRLANETGQNTFQKLIFLIRDWYYPYEHEYGQYGGTEYIKKWFEMQENKSEETKLTCDHIKSCFSQMRCFLMPFPGEKVTKDAEFRGKLSEIASDFKDCVFDLVPLLLSPENLITKRINNRIIYVHQFVEYFKTYSKVFESGHLPTAMTILEATATVNNKKIIEESKNFYQTRMQNFCNGWYKKPEVFQEEHLRLKNIAIERFQRNTIMGGIENHKKCFEELNSYIEERFNVISRQNGMKISIPLSLCKFLIFVLTNTKPEEFKSAILVLEQVFKLLQRQR